ALPISVPWRKITGKRRCSRRIFREDPSVFPKSLIKPLIVFRVTDIHSGTKHCTMPFPFQQRSFQSCSIDSSCHAADDVHSGFCQFSPILICHLPAVCACLSCSYNCRSHTLKGKTFLPGSEQCIGCLRDPA